MAGIALLLWIALLGVILLRPFPADAPYPSDDLIRNTIRLALLYYAFAATAMLRLRAEDWAAFTSRGRLARLLWSLAWLAYVIHLAMAFHYAHGWSHADAMRHVEDEAGVGEGIFVSHLFTLLWSRRRTFLVAGAVALCGAVAVVRSLAARRHALCHLQWHGGLRDRLHPLGRGGPVRLAGGNGVSASRAPCVTPALAVSRHRHDSPSHPSHVCITMT